jgi:hypothetical protein
MRKNSVYPFFPNDKLNIANIYCPEKEDSPKVLMEKEAEELIDNIFSVCKKNIEKHYPDQYVAVIYDYRVQVNYGEFKYFFDESEGIMEYQVGNLSGTITLKKNGASEIEALLSEHCRN